MKNIYYYLTLFLFCCFHTPLFSINDLKYNHVAPGVYKISLGNPDSLNPYKLCAEKPRLNEMSKLAEGQLPFLLNKIIITKNDRGCSVAIPLGNDEQLYGFGLQMKSFEQRGLKKRPIVNDNPLNNLGLTHAPQPFYVSTAGYGVIINTARYTTFHCGSNERKSEGSKGTEKEKSIKTNTADLYQNIEAGSYVYVDIPNTEGIEVFVISGTNMKDVVEKYNLFSGGGCLPPMWGLGLKYRVKGDFNSQQVLDMANYFRNNNIPCDVLGLEPGWQSKAYSCSYMWSDRFPNPKQVISKLSENGFKVNLWEHAYVHPSSPIYPDLINLSGDFLVWNGLVPDFVLPEARKVFADHHRKLVADGVSGFKLDECDNSNQAEGNATWGFPDMSVFPSGLDGERMHQLFGSLYVKTVNEIYTGLNLRSYYDYRSSGLFMSSVPAVLYSDTYDLKEYIQMICNSSFGGLLWSPELRESESEEELFKRLQLALLSPQAIVNAWYLSNPPWLQYKKDLNNDFKFLANANETTGITRTLVNLRMSLIPYLYSAYYQYYSKGTPPFRPLVMDYHNDNKVRNIDDQYMIGENIMAAPLYKAGNKRKVYFPKGIWYNFNTNEKYEGGNEYEIETAYNQFPIYVKTGTILPLAEPLQSIKSDALFKITCRVYGKNAQPFTLIEDDGVSYDFKNGKFNEINLSISKEKGKSIRKGNFNMHRYQIINWNYIE